MMLLLSHSRVASLSLRASPTFVFCVYLLLLGNVRAAEWSLKGNVNQSIGYDDNVEMLPTNLQGSFKYMIVPVLTFAHKTDYSEVSANAIYGTQVYTEIPELNQDIQNYSLSGVYKTKMIDWGLSSSYSITPTRNTAVQSSGVFNNNSSSNTWTISPSMSYKIDLVNSLILTPSYSETTFTDSGQAVNSDSIGFVDNTTFNVNLGWQRIWSERYVSTVSWFYFNYEPQQKTNNSSSDQPQDSQFDSVGMNFSNDYKWSENWKLEGTVGFRHTESSFNGGNNSSLGFLTNVGVSYTDEKFSSGIYFNRSLIPSNQGQLQELSSVHLNMGYKILEQLSASFSAGYQDSTLIDSISPSSRANFVLEPSLNWQMSQDWTLSASYRYRSQEGDLQSNDFNNGTAVSNLFQISINYNWQGLKN